MRMKLSDYVADYLVSRGVKHAFTVTGGGAMHLNDSFGHKEGLRCIYNHHEQACAIAAEGYARLTGQVALICVTSGPGGTNAITGVVGGWQDSIPMFIISGQVKRQTTTWFTDVSLRQLGDQEFQISDVAKYMTKYTVMVTEPNDIKYHLEKAWYLCNNGRKGPVWLDIPVDVQASIINTESLREYDSEEDQKREKPEFNAELASEILNRIKNAKRPVILAGTGIRLAGAFEVFDRVIDKLNVPVVTAWNAHDLMDDNDSSYAGRPGSVGTRGGNFVVQNADLLLVLGCRLNIRQISYNYQSFAKNAFKIIIDIDKAELCKPTVNADMPIHADVKDVLEEIEREVVNDSSVVGSHDLWLEWCRDVNTRYPVVLTEYSKRDKPLNPYFFISEFSKTWEENERIICGNGSACVITFQAAHIKVGQRLFTNSGCAAMGYGFPAALGCAVAEAGHRVICIDGDGSFQMNIQELQTVVHNRMNIKIVIINNNGYHSIRQTQTNLFEPPMVGVNKDSGVSFPDMEKIAYAYDIPYVRIDAISNISSGLDRMYEIDGPVICEVVVDETQCFEPKLSSKRLPDGTMVSPDIDDMYPFLDRDEYMNNHIG